MNYRIYPTPEFKRLFKKLLKKFPSLKDDLQQLLDKLQESPTTGIPLGSDIYKIRLTISSKGKGKSGGARVITFLVTEEKEIYLVHIYDKGKIDNISKEKILEMIKKAGLL